MHKSKLYRMIILILCTSFFMTACQGETIPELSTEQTALVTEYAANALLSNDKSYNTGIATEEEIAKDEAKKAREQKRLQKAKEAETKGTEETADASGAQNQTVTPVYTDAAQFLGLEGVAFEYKGYEICDSYPPNQGTEEFFALGAAEGKQLMIIKFDIVVTEEKEVDILSRDPVFSIGFGTSGSKRTLTTMLLDDLATFKGIVTPETPISQVLVIEVTQEEANNISTLVLNTKYEGAVADTLLQ